MDDGSDKAIRMTADKTAKEAARMSDNATNQWTRAGVEARLPDKSKDHILYIYMCNSLTFEREAFLSSINFGDEMSPIMN